MYSLYDIQYYKIIYVNKYGILLIFMGGGAASSTRYIRYGAWWD